MSEIDDAPRFEDVDWSRIDRTRRLATIRRVTWLVGVALVGLLYLYDAVYARAYTLGEWRAEPVDWVFLVAVVTLLAYGVVPAIRHRSTVRRIAGEVAAKPAGKLSLGYLLGFVLVGLLAPVVLSNPGLHFEHAFHPPVGFTSGVTGVECLGAVTGEVFERRCHGTWAYPLGTNHRGHPMGFLVASGARVALYVATITAAFVVPIAATVGVAAGLRGGAIDSLLMSYVDVQLSIPALVVYFIGYTYWGPSLLVLLAAFGLLSWGGIARLVRSEVLQRRESGHVLVARSLGASERYLARRHVLPNVTNTLVPATFQLLALLVLFEAGVAFLGYHQLETYSWGGIISEGINAEVGGQMQTRTEHPAYAIWWVSTLPALALTATTLSLKVVGDELRDALDPRQGAER
ncbi:MAG: ABC transporter permease [Haloferacaceae archaeon]